MANEKTDDGSPVKDTLRKFGESTSMKGIPRVFKAPRTSLRILWAAGVLLGIGFGSYLVTELVTTYLKYKVHTTNSECPTCPPTFPDITVCNLNPSYQSGNYTMNQLFEVVYALDAQISQEQLAQMMGQRIDLKTREQFLGEFISLAGYYQNTLLEDITQVMAVDVWRELVVDCNWHGWNWMNHPRHDCMKTSLYRILSPEFQWCITFHTDRQIIDKDIRGLTSIFYLDDFSDAHIPKFLSDLRHAQSRGVRVVLHEAGTLPDLKLGFNVPAGHDTIIKLTANERTHLSHPYSDCTEKEYLENTDAGIENTVQYKYSYDGCINLCQQNYVMNKCGCISAHIPFTPSLLKSKLPFCAQVDGETGDNLFISGMLRAFCAMTVNTSEIQCDCPMPCKSINYGHSVLATEWPHPSYHMAFYEKYIKNQPYGYKFDVYKDIIKSNLTHAEKKAAFRNEELLARNFLQLNIHFPHMTTWRTNDRPSLEADSLMGMLGGVLNLWMGITFITFIELVELCVNLLNSNGKRNFQADRVTDGKSRDKPNNHEVKSAWGETNISNFETKY